MQTKKEVNGYQYSNGCGGKKWKRGRIVFSEGRLWLGNNEYVNVIAKTNLDTLEVTTASAKEAKKFLTEDGVAEYAQTLERINKLF